MWSRKRIASYSWHAKLDRGNSGSFSDQQIIYSVSHTGWKCTSPPRSSVNYDVDVITTMIPQLYSTALHKNNSMKIPGLRTQAMGVAIRRKDQSLKMVFLPWNGWFREALSIFFADHDGCNLSSVPGLGVSWVENNLSSFELIAEYRSRQDGSSREHYGRAR